MIYVKKTLLQVRLIKPNLLWVKKGNFHLFVYVSLKLKPRVCKMISLNFYRDGIMRQWENTVWIWTLIVYIANYKAKDYDNL